MGCCVERPLLRDRTRPEHADRAGVGARRRRLRPEVGSVASACYDRCAKAAIGPSCATRAEAARSQSVSRRVAAPAQRQAVEPGARGAVGERANGPVVGYLANQSASGTKTDTPLLETPQSISVVTKDQIAAQGAANHRRSAALHARRDPRYFRRHTFFDSGKLRGFDAPRYLDGLRLPIDPGTQFAYPCIEP